MAEDNWKARTKRDLIIEVWEALDCESVGAAELKAIQTAVRAKYGDGAVESHASVARLLADEGAELRHPEVLELDVLQRSGDDFSEKLHGLLEFNDLENAAASLVNLERLRNAYSDAHDQVGLRRVRDAVMKAKRRVQLNVADKGLSQIERIVNAEMADWIAVWLRQPELFETWLELRRRSPEFEEKFGAVESG